MKKLFRLSCLVTVLVLGAIFCASSNVYAEDSNEEINEELLKAATSISISPVSKILKLEPDKIYEDSFEVMNNGEEPMNFEVYASPYSYTFSEEDNEYKLGFSNETAFTQIVRWITFKDTNGNFVKNPRFTAKPGEVVKVVYRITTPSSVPDGGQYAVLFAHTISNAANASGVRTEASPGLIVYGRSNSETISSAEISNTKLSQKLLVNQEEKNIVNASARVKNTGNVDFMAYGELRVEGLFGKLYYETPSNKSLMSVIPEVELTVSDRWEDTPYFGIFRATWTVTAVDETETVSRLILILPAPVLIIFILLLTFLTTWIIIMVRKRKERRSRYTV